MEAKFKPSIQQQAVLDTARNTRSSILLKARAGCGKSSTLLMLIRQLIEWNSRTTIFAGAFNRPIATELKNKLQDSGITWKQANASTIHSAGKTAWCRVTGWKQDEMDRRIDPRKLQHLLDEEMKTPEQVEKVTPYHQLILKAVSLAKQRAFGVLCSIEDESKWYDIIDHFGLDEDLPEEADLHFAVKVCIWLYKRSLNRCRETIDYDDMILAPLFFKAKFWQYDWVMIDEAQDTNPARRALALKLLRPGGRFIAVGDDFQAIYGFTGADADSLELIRKATNAITLPLTVTYRCPKTAVRRANQWVPDLEAHPDAPEGVERTIYATPGKKSLGNADRPNVYDEKFTKDDAILCRNSAPLVKMAYALLRRGTACRIEGRAIGEGLVSVVRRWKVSSLTALTKKLTEWSEKEVQKWLAKENELKAEQVADQAQTIISLSEALLADGKTKVDDLVAFIEDMFGDTKEGQKPECLTLSTIHKAKGKEWQRVYHLGFNKYMPSPYARKEWQAQQEINLMYVAVTRTMNETVDIIED